jgi:hypothetical protein
MVCMILRSFLLNLTNSINSIYKSLARDGLCYILNRLCFKICWLGSISNRGFHQKMTKFIKTCTMCEPVYGRIITLFLGMNHLLYF